MSHAHEGYLTFHVGDVVNHFHKVDIDENVYLDIKVKNVGSNEQTSLA